MVKRCQILPQRPQMLIARVLVQEITSKDVEDLGESLCINYQVISFYTNIKHFLIVDRSQKSNKQCLFNYFFGLYNL